MVQLVKGQRQQWNPDLLASVSVVFYLFFPVVLGMELTLGQRCPTEPHLALCWSLLIMTLFQARAAVPASSNGSRVLWLFLTARNQSNRKDVDGRGE